MKYDINNCSVCGNNHARIERYPMIGMYSIHCTNCGRKTRVKFFLKDALQEWNEDAIMEDKEICFE